MIDRNGKAPAGAGTPTRAAGNGLTTNLPFQNHSTASQKKLLISDLLQTGAENGLTLRDLVKFTGQNERAIRRQIQMERKAGQLILSDCKSGYFLPASEYEVRRFIRSMSQRAHEIAAVSRVAEDVLAGMGGQEKLGGW